MCGWFMDCRVKVPVSDHSRSECRPAVIWGVRTGRLHVTACKKNQRCKRYLLRYPLERIHSRTYLGVYVRVRGTGATLG